MPSSPLKSAIQHRRISTPSGPLELLACLPDKAAKYQVILCVHGAHCAAACFSKLLPIFAGAGYLGYSLSLRGHGGSWQPSAFAFHALTGVNSYVADVIAAVDYIESEHPEAALILVGHSMGGGVLQRALGMWEAIAPLRRKPAGVVLLASAPLSGGGMDVARRWQAAEAALVETQSTDIRAVPQDWLTWLRSILTFKVNTGVDTVPQVRNKFFSDDTPEESIIGWLQESKSRLESVRVSLESFWPFADPAAVLGSIDGEARPQERKLLVVSGERDVLISKDATAQALDAYYTVYRGQEEILHTELAGSAHHLMLDIAYEQCADVILRWMQGDNILQT